MSKNNAIGFVEAKQVFISKKYAVKLKFTRVFTVCSNGTILKLIIIFKGKFLSIKLKYIPSINSIEMQNNAWIDSGLTKKHVFLLININDAKLLIINSFCL